MVKRYGGRGVHVCVTISVPGFLYSYLECRPTHWLESLNRVTDPLNRDTDGVWLTGDLSART